MRKPLAPLRGLGYDSLEKGPVPKRAPPFAMTPGDTSRLRALLFELLLLGLSALVASTIIGLAWPQSSEDTVGIRVARLFMGPLFTGGTAALYALASRRYVEPTGELPFPHMRITQACAVMAFGIVAATLGSFALAWLLERAGWAVEEQNAFVKLLEDYGLHSAEFVALCVSALICAPLAEELLFRRLMLTRWSHAVGPARALPMTAVAFALLHPNPSGYLVYTWLGVVFGAAFLKSGRIGVSIAIHAGNNALALAHLSWTHLAR